MASLQPAMRTVLCLVLFSLPLCRAFKPSYVTEGSSRWQHASFSQPSATTTTKQFMFFAEEAGEHNLSIDIVPSTGNEESILRAAEFLVDAFWLDARHLATQPAKGEQEEKAISVSQEAKKSLYQEQASDLMEKYGERMGKRLLDSCLLTAIDKTSGKILGLICISALLFDSRTEQLVQNDDSENLLKIAVANLGPKERRKYKEATAEEIASNLLGDRDLEAVSCISNLAVASIARRSGIASMLCNEAERLASLEWGYETMMLKVEADNEKARNLYEKKLNYEMKCMEKSAVAFRVNIEEGCFVESEADTLILSKNI